MKVGDEKRKVICIERGILSRVGVVTALHLEDPSHLTFKGKLK